MSENQFFLVVPPGLEILAGRELNEKLPGLPEAKIEKGGLTVTAPLELGFTFNLVLKIPSAVLLRVAEFKCRDLPKLYNKVANIRWGQYLNGDKFELSVASSKSRLLHEKKIANSVKEGIERHFVKQPPKKPKIAHAFEIQVRFFDDVCTISIDLSGEPLFKRGYKKMAALAPLRENLAAGLFYALWVETGGFDTLIDPMCGTGTFLIEGQEFWHPNTHREYAFQKRADWVATPVDSAVSGPTRFYGFDKGDKSLQNLRESLAGLSSGMSWTLAVRDSLSNEPVDVSGQKIAIICNPPYGERLTLPKPPKEFYRELIEKMVSLHSVGMGVILPKRYLSLVPETISGYKASQEWGFENGGLPVVFRIYKP
jgi:putative N6-adenine-specific DNA methylase